MQPWAEWFYKSKAWKDCRLAFLRSKFFLCERCGGAASIAHHKVWLTPDNITNPNITLNWDNLEALCQDCHNKEHHSSPGTADGLRFDSDGNLMHTPPHQGIGVLRWETDGCPFENPDTAPHTRGGSGGGG